MSLIFRSPSILSSLFCRHPSTIHRSYAAGRWYPQDVSTRRHYSSVDELTKDSSLITKTGVILDRASAAPVYAPSVAIDRRRAYKLVKGRHGEQLANFVLYEDAMQKSAVLWTSYEQMTKRERTIYLAHIAAVQQRRLTYRDPETGAIVMTISQLLFNGECCGNGCRHCPYELVNASDAIRRDRKWNGSYWV